MINKLGPKPGTPRGNRQRFLYEPRTLAASFYARRITGHSSGHYLPELKTNYHHDLEKMAPSTGTAAGTQKVTGEHVHVHAGGQVVPLAHNYLVETPILEVVRTK